MSRTGEETPTSTLESPIPSVVTRSSDADSDSPLTQTSSSNPPNREREQSNQHNNQTRNDTESNHDAQPTMTNWPRYLIIKSTKPNKTILQENPFIVSKAIESIIGEPKNCKPLKRAGLLLIEVDKKHHSVNLLKTTKLHDIPVEITPHRSLNSSKGVIYCDNLEGYSDEQVREGLQQHRSNACVTEVYRINTRREGQLHPTNLFIITFNTPEVPKEIRVAYNNIKVKLYIPNPRRCFNCQMYGHGKTHCKRELTCAKCGQQGHEYEECENSPFCMHCKKDHACSSKTCPQWQIEKRILTIKYTENISFFEARQRVIPQPNTQKLYSQIVKQSAEISTQTPDWTSNQRNPSSTITDPNQTNKSPTESTSLELSDSMDFASASIKRTRSSSEEDISKAPKRGAPSSRQEVKQPVTSIPVYDRGKGGGKGGQPPGQPRPTPGANPGTAGVGRGGNGKKSSSLPSKPNPLPVPPGTKPPLTKNKFNR